MSGFSLSRLRAVLIPSSTSNSSQPSDYTPLPQSTRSSSPSASSSPHGNPPPPTLPFIVLGMSVLLAWNVLLCLFPHFIALIMPSSPSLALSLPSSLSLLATATNFVSLAWLTFRSSAAGTGSAKNREPNSAIRFGLWTLVALHGALVGGILLVGKEVGEGGARVVLAGLAAWTVGVMWAGSYLQAGVMECAALFGPKEIGAVQLGQGLVAILVGPRFSNASSLFFFSLALTMRFCDCRYRPFRSSLPLLLLQLPNLVDLRAQRRLLQPRRRSGRRFSSFPSERYSSSVSSTSSSFLSFFH